MKTILSKFNVDFKLSESAIEALVSSFEEKQLPKRHILIEPGKVCNYYYFIEKGLIRYYVLVDGREVTTWFSKEGNIAFSMMSAYYNQPAFNYAELLEDCVFYAVSIKKLNQLIDGNLELCNWSRLLHQRGFLELELRHLRLLTMTASERYRLFFEENPELHNRINLGHLASFLGMTQVTLSRVRNSSF